MLSQQNLKWAKVKLGTGTVNIGAVGCKLVSICNGLNERGYDYNPITLNELFIKKGVFDGGNLLNDAKLVLNIPDIFKFHKTISKPKLTDFAPYGDDKYLLIGEVSPIPIGGTGQHFVQVFNVNTIGDPWTGEVELLSKKYKSLISLRVFEITMKNFNFDITKKLSDSAWKELGYDQYKSIDRSWALDTLGQKFDELNKKNIELQEQIVQLQTDIESNKSSIVNFVKQLFGLT